MSTLFSQNLVPNHSFEDESACPNTYGQPGLSLAPPWLAPTLGTPDYFHDCATNWQFDVPVNYVGFQFPNTGDAYMGMISGGSGNNFREYLTCPLTQPLEAGTWYHVSFYINVANNSCGTNRFGAYFSPFQPFQNNYNPLPYNPQVEMQLGIMTDTLIWRLVTGCFEASGGESFITLGNFYLDNQTAVDPACDFAIVYYLIDDVVVEAGPPPEEIDFDLGGPESACFSYTIDPGISGYTMLWEDGSTGPTLTVTESGTYSLTVTDGCNFGVDSIDVTILNTLEPVDIGPPEITLCNGESITISLDPDAGQYEWQDGSNDTEYTISTAGNYSVTLNDGCSEVSDAMDVFIMDSPAPIDLGDDQILCDGDELELFFDPAAGDFTWQDGSHGSSFTISEGGIYSVTISNVCGEVTDEITITGLEIPEVELGPDLQHLCDNDVLELELDPNLGDILWPDGSSQPIFIIDESGIYTVFVTNECGTGSDVVTVSLTSAPEVDLGPDTTLCPAEILVLTSSGSDGNYTWQDQSQYDSLIVTSQGTYSLIITNTCGEDSDIIQVNYAQALIPPSFGPDVTLCPGEQFILDAQNPGAMILWQDQSTADTFLVTSSGLYHVQVSSECETFFDTIQVTFNDMPPQVDLPTDMMLCTGETIVLDGQVTGVEYLWSTDSTTQQIIVDEPGIYSVTVSNACGADQDTVVVTDGGPAPMVDLGMDAAICSGEEIILQPVFNHVSQWLWQDGSNDTTLMISSAGTFSVLVSNACGTATDTILVSILPAIPSLDLGPDLSLCANETFELNIPHANVSIEWHDGSTSPDYLINAPGEVSALISNQCGQAYDTMYVYPLPAIPELNLGSDQSLCPGELITIDPGIDDVSYLWHDGTMGTTFQTDQQSTIILTISNACGTSTDTLEVVESTQGPQVDLGADVEVCSGDTVIILSGISGVQYVWQDGSTMPNFVATVTGQYILNVSNNCGSDADTVLVTISGDAPVPALGPDTTLCEGTQLLLISTASGETNIEWQDGSSDHQFQVIMAGTYILSETNQCGQAADTIEVQFIQAPLPLDLGPDTVLCDEDTLILSAPATMNTIQWQDGSQALEYMVLSPGVYILQVSNECGIEKDTMQVGVDLDVPQLQLESNLLWCEGEIIILDATQSFPANYQWSNGQASAVIEVDTIGIFEIMVSTSCASVIEQVAIVPSSDCIELTSNIGIYVPNVFSPNQDGINDVFQLSFGSDLDVLAMEGAIFDRWGNQLFHSTTNPFAWNGTRDGESLNPGVFVYQVRVTYLELGKETSQVFIGDVTLVK